MLSRHFLNSAQRPYKRYFWYQQPLSNRFSILLGPRGVGKTTALIQYVLHWYQGDTHTQKALYVPVDHFGVGQYSLYDIAETFHDLGGECICFDEIHKYADWSGELKSISDRFPKLKILASGSSALSIQRGSHDLSRRAVIYHMAGMSFREYLGLAYGLTTQSLTLETLLSDHEKQAGALVGMAEEKGLKMLAMFKIYLQIGYFPYFQEFDEIALYHRTLEQSMHTTIESDLLALYPTLTGSSVKKLKKLIAAIAESAPFTPDMKQLKQAVEIGDERTLKTYLNYLEDGGIIRTLSRKGSGLKAMEKPEKIYLHNPNQIYAISARGKENIGNIRETFFAAMLSTAHRMTIPAHGDFFVDGRYTFEIGGKNKTFDQIADLPDAYLALDDMEIGIRNKIPLWLFGFLY